MIREEKIDVVIPWVDNTDKIWRRKAIKYIPEENLDGERYRDYDTIKFCIRSIEQNMPWVNHIYLVTDNQAPKWFKNSNKITIINHDEFIPSEYLPTFNSITITTFLHLIPGISDRFIVFNDDMFVINKTNISDYFTKGLPNDFNIERPISPSIINNFYVFNSLYAINSKFNKKSDVKNNMMKRFNFRYGILNNIMSFVLLPFSSYLGFYTSHSVQAYLKSSFENSWTIFNEELTNTVKHSLRSKGGVTDWLIRYYQLVSGNFNPSSPKKHRYYELGSMDIRNIKRALFSKGILDICINDSAMTDDNDDLVEILRINLENKFPNPSSCEI